MKLSQVESDSKRYLALYDLEMRESDRLKEICEDNGIDFERIYYIDKILIILSINPYTLSEGLYFISRQSFAFNFDPLL